MLSILLVAAIVTTCTWIGWDRTGSDDADLAGWIEAVSTAAAVTVATIAAVFAYYAYKIEEEREAARVDTLRSDQASRVAAWWGEESRQIGPVGERSWGSVRVRGAQFRNASDVPVSEVTICGYIGTNLVGVLDLLSGPPGDEPVFHQWPQETYEFINWLVSDGQAAHELATGMVDLFFTDSHGIRWHRRPNGELAEIARDTPMARQPTEADLADLRELYTPMEGDPLA